MAFKSHYRVSGQHVGVLWHRAGCIFVIINCLSPDSVSYFKHIVLEHCHTSGFCKLTSCWRVWDCGASSFVWQQHPPPRPMRAHTHAHTGIVVEGVLWSSRGERICHMLWLAPLLSSYQLLSKRRFYKIRLVDAVVHFKLLPKLCFRTAILVSNQDFSLTLIEAASHLGQKTIKTLVPRILDVLQSKWNTAFIMNMAS